LSGLLNVVAQSMSHYWHTDSLNVFGQNHFPPVHQRPRLRGVPQGETTTRRNARAMALPGRVEQILKIIE
jgi:hypothetical protein